MGYTKYYYNLIYQHELRKYIFGEQQGKESDISMQFMHLPSFQQEWSSKDSLKITRNVQLAMFGLISNQG